MKRKIDHKVGVKLFTEEQLENVLPTYPNLFHKIDTCREAARAEMAPEEKRHYQYNFMYDNVFSILGKRGTGKTSVVFTLQKMIRDKYGRTQRDVVLPLIIPEAIPDNCQVLGWILAIVKEEVKLLEEKISKLERKDQSESPYWNRCEYMAGKGAETSLSDKLDILCQLFYAGSYNPSNEASYYQAIDNSVLQTVDYYRFAQGVADFWVAWVKEICRYHKLEGRQRNEEKEEDICPLIYFIFDDVDLAPEKIDELLSVIIKYLSHPNIIVLTTADEELFLEVIEKRLDKDIGRLPREWRNFLAQAHANGQQKYIGWTLNRDESSERLQEDLVSKTTRMYLGKVLPSSTRYYLRMFHTAKQKEKFCLEDGKDLGNGVTAEIQRLIDKVDSICQTQGDYKIVNFMKPDSDSVVINFYLKFMGNTSRQIANAYIALKELINNLIIIVDQIYLDRYEQQFILSSIYQNFRYFLGVAIRANHELAEVIEFVDEFVDEVFLPEYNQWIMYFNYSFIEEFLKKNLDDDAKQRKIQIGLQLYAMFAFLENLLLIMEKAVPEGITRRKKVHVVHFLSEYVERVALEERYVFRDDLAPDVFLKHYVNFLDRLPTIITDNSLDEKKFNKEYFYSFVSYPYKEENVSDELIELYRNNHKCFAELVRMLAMVYGNAYLFDKQNMEDCTVYAKNEYIIKYQIVIRTNMQDNIAECLRVLKLQAEWKQYQNAFEKIFDRCSKGVEQFYNLMTEVAESLQKSPQDKSQYVMLSKVISEVIERCKKGKLDRMQGDQIIFCSSDILDDLKEYEQEWGSRKEKENLIREFAEEIRGAERSIGKYAFLFDPNNMIRTLRKMLDRWSALKEPIDRIFKQLQSDNKEDNVEKEGQILISKQLYYEIIRLLTSVLESDIIKDDDFVFENISTEEIKGILSGLDIAVSLKENDELMPAVNLGLRVFILEELERAYIYQTIAERYDTNHDSSSRNLESVSMDGQSKDTYYNSMFKLIEEILKSDNKKKIAGKKSKKNGLENLRDDLQRICFRERQKYVTTLLQGDENE